MQKALLEFIKGGQSKKHRCPICGAEFRTEVGLKVHVARVHNKPQILPPNPEIIHPDENVKITYNRDGKHVTISIKMRKSLFDDIAMRAWEEGIPIVEAIMKAMINLAAFGTEVAPLGHQAPPKAKKEPGIVFM